MRIRHRVFNPLSGIYGLSVLDAICTDMERDGWILINIVPHTQFESVAIFQQIEIPEEEEEEDDPPTDRAYL